MAEMEVARQMSEVAPPSAPIEYPEPVDWSVLIAICGGAYLLVMVLVVTVTCWCRSKRNSSQNQNFSSFTDSEQGAPAFRQVDRARSWKHRANTEPAHDLSTIPAYIKLGFIRKVYSILATQLIATVGIVVGMIYMSFRIVDGGPTAEPPYTDFGETVMSSYWIIFVLLIPLIMIICALQGMKNKYPHNYILLSVFTVIESFTVGFICVLYFARGFGEQILLAFAITLLIFLVLTLFTMQSKVDWSFLGPFLFVSLFIMMFWSFFTFWLVPGGGFAARKLISLAGAIIFSFFIIYDTNNIMKHMGVDDYIIAAIELYLDIINLFQYLLMLLANSRG